MSDYPEIVKNLLGKFYDRHDLAMIYFEDGAPARAGDLLREAAAICDELAAERLRYVRGIAE